MDHQMIFKLVAEDMKLPEEVVKLAYESSWGFIRHTIEELPLTSITEEEEFNKLRTNFNIPSIGKLYVTYDRILGKRKCYEYLMSLKENNEN